MKQSIGLCIVLALITSLFRTAANANEGYWMSPPLSGYAHVSKNPTDNFLNPELKSSYTSSLDGVTAKVTTTNFAFPTDGCKTGSSKCVATLQVSRQGKTVLTKNFSGMSSISGPRMVANVKSPPTVTVDFVDAHENYYSWDFDKKSGSYKKAGDCPEPTADEKRTEPPIYSVRTTKAGTTTATLKWNASFGNLNNGGTSFNLEIKNGLNIVWSGLLPLNVPDTNLDGRSIECFGPVVLPLDNTKKQFVLVRCVVPVTENGSEDLKCVDFIFFDNGSSKYKCFAQQWSGAAPHLADHERDGVVEFITQNHEFGKTLWSGQGAKLKNGSGGPMQIWRWKKDGLVDVTNELPVEVKRHADASLKQFKSEPDHPECYLLGYVADLCLLGQQQNALNVLDQLATPNSVKEKNLILERLKAFGYLR